MITLAKWMAGWGAAFAPSALIAGVALLNGSPEAWLLAWASSFSALLFGLLGSLVGLALRDVAGALTTAGVPALCLGFMGLLPVLASDAPLLFLSILGAFLLPPPIGAASTAWLLTRPEAA